MKVVRDDHRLHFKAFKCWVPPDSYKKDSLLLHRQYDLHLLLRPFHINATLYFRRLTKSHTLKHLIIIILVGLTQYKLIGHISNVNFAVAVLSTKHLLRAISNPIT